LRFSPIPLYTNPPGFQALLKNIPRAAASGAEKRRRHGRQPKEKAPPQRRENS
jgi:hypothetical protein